MNERDQRPRERVEGADGGRGGSPGRRTLTQSLPPSRSTAPPVGAAPFGPVDAPEGGAPVAGYPDPFGLHLDDAQGPTPSAAAAAARAGLGDVSGVRIHDNSSAHALAATHGARALAVGSDVYFGDGEYRPGTPDGDHLLGHELAHTAQQRGAHVPAFAAKLRTTTPGDASEAEADTAGEAFAAAAAGRDVAPIAITAAPATLARFAGPTPAVSTQAPIGNQNYAPPNSTDDLERGKEAAEGARKTAAGRANAETPTLTIRPGGDAPDFITTTSGQGQMTQGPTREHPHNAVVDFVPRLFHVIPAIKHDAAQITTPDELLTIWTLYLLDEPQPAPWTGRVPGAMLNENPLKLPAGGGSDDRPRASWVQPWDQMRLPNGAAASAILRRLIRMHGPHDDPGGGARRAVLIETLTARAREVEALHGLIPANAGKAKDATGGPNETNRPRPIPTLVLPAGKFDHLGRYQQMARDRRLVHDPLYDRPDAAQRTKWLAEMAPGAPDGLTPGAHADGLDVLQRTARDSEELVIPNWSMLSPHAIMEVDHVIELQLVLPSDVAWADSMSNYELLERGPNRSSGRLLDHNISKERQRLYDETGDPSYLTSLLHFEQVVPGGGATGGRWSQDHIRHGVHFKILRAKLGLHDPRFP